MTDYSTEVGTTIVNEQKQQSQNILIMKKRNNITWGDKNQTHDWGCNTIDKQWK